MSTISPHRNATTLGQGKKPGQFLLSGRKKWIFVVGAILSLLVARPLLAADLSGTWELAYWTDQDRQTITLEIVQEGPKVLGSGTVRGDSLGGVVQVEVRSGTAVGGDFHFVLVSEGMSVSRGQEFSGSWYRDEMSGQTNGAFGSRMFTGIRRQMGG